MKLKEYDLPDNLLYDENYGWVRIEGETATIGVTEIGVKQTKEIAYVELPNIGDKFKKGEDYAVMEAAKWAGSLKMPLSGEITEVNEEKLLDDPALLNRDPYGEGWIIKIKIENPEEIEELMDVKEASEFYKEKMEKK
jgi:glycine cleavage system H protein